MVAHRKMWWFKIGLCGGSYGDVVAHMEMWWHIGRYGFL